MKSVLLAILCKMASGRYVITLVCSAVFAYCAVKKIIGAEAIMGIIGSVVTAYFNRNDRTGKPNEEGK